MYQSSCSCLIRTLGLWLVLNERQAFKLLPAHTHTSGLLSVEFSSTICDCIVTCEEVDEHHGRVRFRHMKRLCTGV
jgi:hypothetical protein